MTHPLCGCVMHYANLVQRGCYALCHWCSWGVYIIPRLFKGHYALYHSCSEGITHHAAFVHGTFWIMSLLFRGHDTMPLLFLGHFAHCRSCSQGVMRYTTPVQGALCIMPLLFAARQALCHSCFRGRYALCTHPLQSWPMAWGCLCTMPWTPQGLGDDCKG